MTFRLKLQLAMLLVVLAVTGATLLVVQRDVEATYRRLFQDRFAGDVEYAPAAL